VRGKDKQQLKVFSYTSLQQRVSDDRPLRPTLISAEESREPQA
jgi:hypothetical protein